MIEVVLTGLLSLAIAVALYIDGMTVASLVTSLPTAAAVVTCVVFAINVGQLAKCYSDWSQSGRASRISVGSWLVSIVAWFSGPWAPIAMLLSLATGIPSWLRSDGSAATRRAGRMAVCNTLTVILVILALQLWATHSPDLQVIG